MCVCLGLFKLDTTTDVFVNVLLSNRCLLLCFASTLLFPCTVKLTTRFCVSPELWVYPFCYCFSCTFTSTCPVELCGSVLINVRIACCDDQGVSFVLCLIKICHLHVMHLNEWQKRDSTGMLRICAEKSKLKCLKPDLSFRIQHQKWTGLNWMLLPHC